MGAALCTSGDSVTAFDASEGGTDEGNDLLLNGNGSAAAAGVPASLLSSSSAHDHDVASAVIEPPLVGRRKSSFMRRHPSAASMDVDRKVSVLEGERSFERDIMRCLRPRYYKPGTYIVEEGAIGSEMYFIKQGKAEVCAKDGTVVATLQAGQFFGEIAILFPIARTASVRAGSPILVNVLRKDDLDLLLASYPAIRERFNSVAQERLEALEKTRASNVVSRHVLLGNTMSMKGHDVRRMRQWVEESNEAT